MRVRHLVALLAVGAVLAMAPVLAQKTGQAQTMLEAARQKETLQGDLAGAIKQYQAIVDQFGKTDRAAAAQALVAMAECYRKLGDAQARTVYERIVREFGDQKEAATLARARLGATAAPAGGAGMVNTQKWTGPKVGSEGMVSPDGRYLSFVDWETGNLALHDLTTGVDRHLTNQGTWNGDFAEESAISRDGADLAYAWYDQKKGRYEVRLLKLGASGGATSPRTIFDDPSVSWIGPYDWTPDGRSIAVGLGRKEPTEQVGLLNARDGSLRVLKAVGGHVGRMFFSPDGSLIAYDVSAGQDLSQRDVHVVSTDGRRDVPAVVHPGYDMVVGWSPDGRSLLFASNRAGSFGLWAQPFDGGVPHGAPTLVKDLGNQFRESLGLTRSGSLLYAIRTEASTIHIASIDFETGKALAPPTQAVESYQENVGPDWSADGKSLVYTTQERLGTILSILTLDTRQIRAVRPQLNLRIAARPRWTRDGALIVQGKDQNGDAGIYRVDPQTAAVTTLVVEESPQRKSPAQSSLSPDGTLLFYRAGGGDRSVIIERNLATGVERELLRTKSLSGPSLSPDGHELAFIDQDLDATTSTLNTLDIRSGQVRELFRTADPISLSNFTEWTPDGKRILFGQSQNNRASAWMIPRTGGTAVKLDLQTTKLSGFNNPRIHPDGTRIAYVSGDPKWEVWTLENFLPAPATAKK